MMALSWYLIRFVGIILVQVVLSLLIGFAIRIYNEGKEIRDVQIIRERANSTRSASLV